MPPEFPAPFHYSYKLAYLAYLVGQSINQKPHRSLSNSLFYLWPTEERLIKFWRPQFVIVFFFLFKAVHLNYFPRCVVLKSNHSWLGTEEIESNLCRSQYYQWLNTRLYFTDRRTEGENFALQFTFQTCYNYLMINLVPKHFALLEMILC